MELSNSHDLELCKHMVLTTSTALLELQLIMTDIEILDQIKQNMSLMKDKESLHLFVGYLQRKRLAGYHKYILVKTFIRLSTNFFKKRGGPRQKKSFKIRGMKKNGIKKTGTRKNRKSIKQSGGGSIVFIFFLYVTLLSLVNAFKFYIPKYGYVGWMLSDAEKQEVVRQEKRAEHQDYIQSKENKKANDPFQDDFVDEYVSEDYQLRLESFSVLNITAVASDEKFMKTSYQIPQFNSLGVTGAVIGSLIGPGGIFGSISKTKMEELAYQYVEELNMELSKGSESSISRCEYFNSMVKMNTESALDSLGANNLFDSLLHVCERSTPVRYSFVNGVIVMKSYTMPTKNIEKMVTALKRTSIFVKDKLRATEENRLPINSGKDLDAAAALAEIFRQDKVILDQAKQNMASYQTLSGDDLSISVVSNMLSSMQRLNKQLLRNEGVTLRQYQAKTLADELENVMDSNALAVVTHNTQAALLEGHSKHKENQLQLEQTLQDVNYNFDFGKVKLSTEAAFRESQLFMSYATGQVFGTLFGGLSGVAQGTVRPVGMLVNELFSQLIELGKNSPIIIAIVATAFIAVFSSGLIVVYKGYTFFSEIISDAIDALRQSKNPYIIKITGYLERILSDAKASERRLETLNELKNQAIQASFNRTVVEQEKIIALLASGRINIDQLIIADGRPMEFRDPADRQLLN